mgnify:CR=1 FL=1
MSAEHTSFMRRAIELARAQHGRTGANPAVGCVIVQGNRMAHLLGAGVSKGRALKVLKQRLGVAQVRVLGLGDSPNDLPLLEAADVAVVVPGESSVRDPVVAPS